MALSGILIIDKPEDWTSHDVIAKLRGLLKERRIGHGGTLDPMATGVLPVFVGRATKGVEFCESADKEYLAGLRLGVTTDTQDTTGTVLKTCKVDVSSRELSAVIEGFKGNQRQLPPMYSAVKIKGQKLYDLARKGIEVERTPRDITIHELEILGGEGDEYLLRVVCSKGTYIRTLCHDIGQALGCGAAMSSLRRTRSGVFTLEDAVSLEDVADASAWGEASGLLAPIDSLFSGLPEIFLRGEDESRCRNGAPVPCGAAAGEYRVYGENGSFLMVGRVERNILKSVKNFFEVT